MGTVRKEIKNIISAIRNKDSRTVKKSVESVLNKKIQVALDNKKVDIATNFFSEKE